MTNDAMLELQHKTIEARTALMKEAGAVIAEAEVKLLMQKSAIAQYEQVLAVIVGNLGVMKMSPVLANSMLEQTLEFALNALRNNASDGSYGLPGVVGMNWTEDDKRRDPEGWRMVQSS